MSEATDHFTDSDGCHFVDGVVAPCCGQSRMKPHLPLMGNTQEEYRVVGKDGRTKGDRWVWTTIGGATVGTKWYDDHEPHYAPHSVEVRVVGEWQKVEREQ